MSSRILVPLNCFISVKNVCYWGRKTSVGDTAVTKNKGGRGGGGKGLYYNTELNSPMGSQCSESYQRVHYKSSNGAKVKWCVQVKRFLQVKKDIKRSFVDGSDTCWKISKKRTSKKKSILLFTA
jgi:hypothetical protein